MAALGGSVSRRYARALFEIGVEKQSFEALEGELLGLAQAYSGSEMLRNALENPVFRMAQRRAVLEGVLPRVAPSPEARKLAVMLLEKSRIGQLPNIARAFREMTDARLGRVRATVTSAKPLPAATLAEVQRALERRTKKKVLVTAAIDPALIGGIVARVGDLLLDGSVRTRLDTLKTRVLN